MGVSIIMFLRGGSMAWYVVEISEAAVGGGLYHQLCRRFQQAFIREGAPVNMAMFAQRMPFNHVRVVFFSPGSLRFVRALVEEYEGVPCVAPCPDEVTLIFGVSEAKERLLLDVATKAAQPPTADPHGSTNGVDHRRHVAGVAAPAGGVRRNSRMPRSTYHL
jgi:hypothetical protein